MKKCVVCSNEVPKRRNKYCSVSCIKKQWRITHYEQARGIERESGKRNWRKYQEAYEKKHPGKIQEIKRKSYEKNYVCNIITDKSMQAKNSIEKGRILEDFVAKKLRENGIDKNARRTRGSGSGMEKGDIYNSCGLNIECKNTKKFMLDKFWKQTLRDSEKTHTTPILIWHLPEKPIEECAVVMTIDDWADLMQKQNEVVEVETNFSPELKWKVKRLKDAAHEVFKVLDN